MSVVLAVAPQEKLFVISRLTLVSRRQPALRRLAFKTTLLVTVAALVRLDIRQIRRRVMNLRRGLV